MVTWERKNYIYEKYGIIGKLEYLSKNCKPFHYRQLSSFYHYS